MFKIDGTLQHFAWGDTKAIASVRGVEPSGEPEAEFWFGTHPKGPSRVILPAAELDPSPPSEPEAPVELAAFIAADKQVALGPAVTSQFDELPFLLKLLAAVEPLSIQAHPNRTQAARGFEREDRQGVDRQAPNRNYRDRNHKPELICALTRFEAKCGFRAFDDTKRLLSRFDDPRVQPLRALLKVDHGPGQSTSMHAALAEAVRWLLTADTTEAAELVDGLVSDAKRLLAEMESSEPSPIADFEADLQSVIAVNKSFPGDPGVAVSLLLNHIVLEPGQALFLEAGVLHSYLGGLAVELLANSDNVLRGGLTPKHVDVDELLTVIRYETYDPTVQRPSGPVHRYRIPARDFALARYGPPPRSTTSISGQPFNCTVNGPEIVLATGGPVELIGETEVLQLASGEAAFVPFAQESYSLCLLGSTSIAWRAGVGDS